MNIQVDSLFHKTIEIKDKILKSVALVESRIKNRLVELSHG